jgi:hypothetical protein
VVLEKVRKPEAKEVESFKMAGVGTGDECDRDI